MQDKCVIIFESTVYPGVTESITQKILEIDDTITLGQDSEICYSPERLSQGRILKLTDIVRIYNNEPTKIWIVTSYSSFISAGIFEATSIKVAEGAKILENIQRDVNIALMNEVSVLMKTLGVDIYDVIEAASSKGIL